MEPTVEAALEKALSIIGRMWEPNYESILWRCRVQPSSSCVVRPRVVWGTRLNDGLTVESSTRAIELRANPCSFLVGS